MADPPEQSTPLDPPLATDVVADEAVSTRSVAPAEHGVGQGASFLSGVRVLWTLVARLIMLGCGVGVGWTLGVLVAQVFPSTNPHPPFQEVAMRSTSQTWRKLRQLPQWWRGSDLAQEPLDEQAAEAPLPVAAPEVAPRLTLSPELQEQVEADFAQIQSDLGSVESQLTDLEASLGEVPSEDSIETRLQAIEQLLTSGEREDIPAALPPPPRSAPPSGAGSSVYQEPPFSLISDSIVLPSSLLFEPGGSLLTPTGQQLLDTIVPDLRRYPEATLLVGSHTASNNDPQADRKLTFQQALAVQRYLDQQLGDTGVHWVTLGYGQTRPRVAGAGLEAQQRNQRVEIGIVPQ